jgi:pimeloyl-ACP methyl ester carboxylesterase
MRRFVALVLFFTLALLPTSMLQAAPDEPGRYVGKLADGAPYLIDVPAGWNGTLLLYSHGYASPGSRKPDAVAPDAPDARSKVWLLAHGFALAGSSYAADGWAVAEALTDQMDVLTEFARVTSRTPRRTIAWGHSMGGLITAALVERNPATFSGALPMCGVVAGSTPFLETRFDLLFAFKTLLAPAATSLQITAIHDPDSQAELALALLDAAQEMPLGRARIALVADIAEIPGWYGRNTPEPAPGDSEARELAQYNWLKTVGVSKFSFDAAAEIETRAHGSPSSNVNVSYTKIFANARGRAQVDSLYAHTSTNVHADLAKLDAAPRVPAQPSAVDYTNRFTNLTGRITVPVLSMHTTADGLVPVGNESAYDALVGAAGKSQLLRQTFVARSGHCAFTPGETIAALKALVARTDTGTWDGKETPEGLDAAATLLGPDFSEKPAFVAFSPPAFLR